MSGIARRVDDHQLSRISDEVNRISQKLARISSTPEGHNELALVPQEGRPIKCSPERVKAEIRARRLRASYFSGDLFADPAWDMMLFLLQAELMQWRVSTSRLCRAADVPATTALRWLNTLVQQNIACRRDDPFDGRRTYIELTPMASAAMHRYFADAFGSSAR